MASLPSVSFGGAQACPTADAGFTDTSTTFAKTDIDCIYGLGITHGTSPTTYSPDNDVTRAQMAAFLARTWRAAVAAGFNV